jgi:V/A-type H+-transporting ATPase subunit A
MNLGKITGINGNLLRVAFSSPVAQNEVGYARVGNLRPEGRGDPHPRRQHAELQVFEDTSGLRVGDAVEFTGELLSVELGPGLLGSIYDGLQNPLPQLAEQSGFFLQRGQYLQALDRDAVGVHARGESRRDGAGGDTLGTVPEGIFQHRIMVPFRLPVR